MENKLQLKDILTIDLKNAMKSKDTVSKNTIQSLRAAILQYEIDNNIVLDKDDTKLIDIIAIEQKKRYDALEQFKKSDREDLINQTLKEIEIISKYLPKQLTDEELIQQVNTIIKTEKALSIKDMGKVMKVAKEQLGNTVNGKRLADCVKQQLSKGVN